MILPRTLLELEDRLARDLALLNYPPAQWVFKRSTSQGEAIEDVVILGGGMCGIAAAYALRRKGIAEVRVLDSQPEGLEGPWITFARMETLRSPKNLVGPAKDTPALTFRAWFEAKYGEEEWDRLDKIPRTMWMDYLIWYRRVLHLPVENSIKVDFVEPHETYLKVTCTGAVDGPIFARKVVIATGRSGQGRLSVPSWAAEIPEDRRAHSSDDIDFTQLRGRNIIVIGAGASAMDNAAAALESGAAEVRVLVRRPTLPRINKLMGVSNPGFTEGFPLLSDAWRWRIMHYSNDTQTPPPRRSVQRISQHKNAFIETGFDVARVESGSDGPIRLTSSRGSVCSADFVIFGTGFEIDMNAPNGLIKGSDNILLWSDRYHPPVELSNVGLAQSPYLDHGFRFSERDPGRTPWLHHLHCFNHAASLSLGKVGGDIPRVGDGAEWLASAIASSLYLEDIDQHWHALETYNTTELLGDEWIPQI